MNHPPVPLRAGRDSSSLVARFSLHSIHYVTCLAAYASYFVAVLTYYRIYYFAIAFATWLSIILVLAGRDVFGPMIRQGASLVLFFLYLAATSLWAVYPDRALQGTAIDSIFILVWGSAYALGRRNDEFRLSRLFVFFPYVIALTYAYLMLTYGTVRPISEETARAMGAVANIAATTLALCLPFLLWRMVQGERARLVEVVLVFALVGLSQSRTGIALALFCTICSLASIRGMPRTRPIRTIIHTLVALLVAIGASLLFPESRLAIESGFNRMIETLSDAVNFVMYLLGAVHRGPEALSAREIMLTEGWQAFVESPYLGIGYQNLGPWISDRVGYEVVSHNLFLTLLSESGWLALLIFAWIVGEALSRLLRKARFSGPYERGFYRACLISLLGMLLMSMFHQLHQYQVFYIVLAFAHAAGQSQPARRGRLGGACSA